MEASAALEDKEPTSDSAAKISNFFGKFIDFFFRIAYNENNRTRHASQRCGPRRVI